MKYLYTLLFCLLISVPLLAQNVGIGTTSPSEKLHVANGNLLLSQTSAPNDVIFNMPPGENILSTKSEGLTFKVDGTQKGAIELVNRGSSGNILRMSVSPPGSYYHLVIDESGSVGIGTGSPNNSAALHISSSTKGLLIPSMTRASRDAITTPSTGLLLYQTNETPGFYYNAGSSGTPNWVNMAKRVDTLVIGAHGFFPGSTYNSDPYITDAHSARYINVTGSTDELTAAVNLPAGVTVKQMKVFYYDETNASDLKFSLNENYLAAGLMNETVYNYTSSSNAAGVRTATINNNYTVKSNLYSYYLSVRPSAGSWSFSGYLKIKGVMLVYEY